MIQTIDCYLNEARGSLDTENIDNRYITITNFKERSFFKQIDPESVVETCLTTLTLLSPMVVKRVELINMLQGMLAVNLHKIIDVASPLI